MEMCFLTCQSQRMDALRKSKEPFRIPRGRKTVGVKNLDVAHLQWHACARTRETDSAKNQPSRMGCPHPTNILWKVNVHTVFVVPKILHNLFSWMCHAARFVWHLAFRAFSCLSFLEGFGMPVEKSCTGFQLKVLGQKRFSLNYFQIAEPKCLVTSGWNSGQYQMSLSNPSWLLGPAELGWLFTWPWERATCRDDQWPEWTLDFIVMSEVFARVMRGIRGSCTM